MISHPDLIFTSTLHFPGPFAGALACGFAGAFAGGFAGAFAGAFGALFCDPCCAGALAGFFFAASAFSCSAFLRAALD